VGEADLLATWYNGGSSVYIFTGEKQMEQLTVIIFIYISVYGEGRGVYRVLVGKPEGK
jgi:hypothetical protein